MSPAPQRHRVATSAGVFVSLACLVLLTADASLWFELVPVVASGLLATFSLFGLAVFVAARLKDRRARKERFFALSRLSLFLVTCLTGVLLLGANSLLRGHQVRTLPARGGEMSRLDVKQRAVEFQREFHLLLDRMSAPLETARARLEAFSGEPTVGFDLIDHIEEKSLFARHGGGLSLYRRDGVALAWTGSSYPAPAGLFDLLPIGVITFRAVAEEHQTRLHALLASRNHILVTETKPATKKP